MALELDDRQRAMLLEMGVRVWLPGTAFAVAPDDAVPVPAPVRVPASDIAVPVAARPAAPDVRASQPSQPLAPKASVVNAAVSDLSGADWSSLAQSASQCSACGLCAGRKHSSLQPPAAAQGWAGAAHWMVVGDAPDEDEDASGSSFAGASGVLLANMLKAIGVVRINDTGAPGRAAMAPAKAAYVTNVVKCRAPHGAVPQADDLLQCAAYLQREIALVQPKMILAMGRFANQLLLTETPELVNLPLGKVRGSVYRYQGVQVVLTYHPKILLRNSADKAKAWADLCLAADTVDALVL